MQDYVRKAKQIIEDNILCKNVVRYLDSISKNATGRINF